MHEFLENIANVMSEAIGGLLGLDGETVKIAVVILVILHLLCHEVPMLILFTWGFFKLFCKRKK